MEKDKTGRTELAGFEDTLSDLLGRGARKLILEAVQVEMETFIESTQALKLADGRQAVVRNGYLPERELLTGLGAVQVPQSRDRSQTGIRFSSSLIPPYLKRSQKLEELLPVLYLKGISSGDFQEALAGLLGQVPKVSPRQASAV